MTTKLTPEQILANIKTSKDLKAKDQERKREKARQAEIDAFCKTIVEIQAADGHKIWSC